MEVLIDSSAYATSPRTIIERKRVNSDAELKLVVKKLKNLFDSLELKGEIIFLKNNSLNFFIQECSYFMKVTRSYQGNMIIGK